MGSWAMEMLKTDFFRRYYVHWTAEALFLLLVELTIQQLILNQTSKCIVGDGMFSPHLVMPFHFFICLLNGVFLSFVPMPIIQSCHIPQTNYSHLSKLSNAMLATCHLQKMHNMPYACYTGCNIKFSSTPKGCDILVASVEFL